MATPGSPPRPALEPDGEGAADGVRQAGGWGDFLACLRGFQAWLHAREWLPAGCVDTAQPTSLPPSPPPHVADPHPKELETRFLSAVRERRSFSSHPCPLHAECCSGFLSLSSPSHSSDCPARLGGLSPFPPWPGGPLLLSSVSLSSP